MKKHVFVTLAALVAAFVMSGAIAYAQVVRAEIGFPFVVNGKEMSAGNYSVDAPAGGPVTITGPGGQRSIMLIVTTLGRHDKDPDPEFVFDKTGGKLVLSEVWIPGRDGLLLVATKAPHEHAVLGGSNPRK